MTGERGGGIAKALARCRREHVAPVLLVNLNTTRSPPVGVSIASSPSRVEPLYQTEIVEGGIMVCITDTWV